METRKRSLMKAVSYRFFGLLVTTSVVYAFTGRLDLAGGIGLADAALKIGAFYYHERLWMRIAYGRTPAAEYEI